MRCPYCNKEEIKVIETRETSETITRRRRECLTCTKRFTTYERIELVELVIIKKNNSRELFDRQKLISGMKKACEKRPVTQEQIEKTVDSIESELRQQESIEIPSKKIGELIMRKLKKLDKIAYIRFASVYRDFTDLDSFKKEIIKII